MHGILLGYNVSFIATDSRINRRWSTITVNQSAASVVVTNLRKFTKYMVTVEGFTSKGSGIESKSVAISTDEDSKIILNFFSNSFSNFQLPLDRGKQSEGMVRVKI